MRYKGKTKLAWFPTTASTALAKDSIVTLTSGQLVAATSSTAAVDCLGVIRHAITATDSDYATSHPVEVEIPVDKNVVWKCTTASLVVGDVGAEVDLSDAVTVNRGGTSIKVAKCVQVISATVGLFLLKFNGSY